MWRTVSWTAVEDSSGKWYASIRRYDTGRKNTGGGRVYRLTASSAERAGRVIRSEGYHFMHRQGNAVIFGKLVV